MLLVYTNLGVFNWKDLYKEMLYNNIRSAEVEKVTYCHEQIFGKNKYSIEEVKEIAYGKD